MKCRGFYEYFYSYSNVIKQAGYIFVGGGGGGGAI